MEMSVSAKHDLKVRYLRCLQCDLPKERESVSSSDYGREGYCDICEFSPEVLGAEGQKR